MKRKLALFLVLAMILSLIPANVFAATDNTINKVPTVADDRSFDATDAPKLRIQENNTGEFGSDSQTFVLKLANAEWVIGDEAAFEAVAPVNFGGTATVAATYLSTTRMEITLNPGTGSTGTAEGYALLPLVAELQGEGAATVTIEPKSSAVTGGTYTFAIGSGGDTAASIDDVTTFRDTATIENILIEELVAGTLTSGSEIKLKITDGDFDWEGTPTVVLTGGFAGWTHTKSFSGNVMTLTIGGAASSNMGTISINGLKINPSSDASFGDVSVKIYGTEVTEETLVVGKYADYTVTAEADDSDLPTIYAGDLAEGYLLADVDTSVLGLTGTDLEDGEEADLSDTVEAVDGEENEIMQLNISEDVANSWAINRETKISFDDSIKIIDFDVEKASNIAVTGVTGEATEAEVEDAIAAGFEIGDSELTFDTLDVLDDADTMELNIQFYVSVAADAVGDDIVATVGGRAIGDDFKVTLGEVVAPITATVEVKDVKIGVQDQATGNVTITEAADGVLEDGSEVVLTLDDESGLAWSATPEFKVTKGDIEIDEVEKDGDVITVTVDQESSTAGTFELTGFEVDINRTVPEGDFNITIGGNAIVKNFEDDGDYYFFDADNAVDTKYVRVITPAPGDTQAGETVVFTIGSADYMIGATKMTSDAAPYINENGRTMLPLRALANALGVTDSNIVWNDPEHSVVIFKGDATLKVVIGQMFFNKNGVLVPMDTQAVIMNSRTFLPLRAMGEALGAVITWDEATRTVTVN